MFFPGASPYPFPRQEKDLETWLEVGAWTWNWMEPPLGTITFVLLCIQLSRSHMQVNVDARSIHDPDESGSSPVALQ